MAKSSRFFGQTRQSVRTLILLGVIIECPLFLWIFFANVDDIEVARTQVFMMFVLIELILAVNFRSLRYSIFKAPPHGWLLLAIFWELILIAVLIQFEAVREAFGIAMPTLADIGFIVAIGIGISISIEIAKAVLRNRYPARSAPSLGSDLSQAV